jgi:uncharacterized protein (TIGR00369 family)
MSGRAGCFGCAPDNPRGLRLSFEGSGGELAGAVQLGAEYESHPGTIHGGIVATVLDEAMARAAERSQRRPVMTMAMRVRYIEPARTGEPYQARAAVLSAEAGTVFLRGELWNGELIAVAHGTYRVL